MRSKQLNTPLPHLNNNQQYTMQPVITSFVSYGGRNECQGLYSTLSIRMVLTITLFVRSKGFEPIRPEGQ